MDSHETDDARMSRYRRIDPRIWHDDKFPRLTRDARLLFFHLITSPRSNSIGCYVQGRPDMAEYCGFSLAGLSKALRELVEIGLVRYQPKTRLVFLPHFFRYNPIENENQAKFAATQATEIPAEPTFLTAILEGLAEAKPYLEPFRQVLAERLRQGTRNGMPNNEHEHESEPEPEVRRRRSSSATPGEWPSPEALVALYNAGTPDECPEVETLSPERRRKAGEYLTAFPEQAWWAALFARMHRSKFLRGLKRRPGHEHFVGDFDWLLTKGKDGTENCVKVAEGRYDDRG